MLLHYLWRNFHVSFAANDEEFLEPEPTTVPEEELLQEEVILIELINDTMLEDMDMDVDDEEEEKQHETQLEEDQQQTPPHQAWYSPITSFIDHVNSVLQKLCTHPGWQVPIDEMLHNEETR
jgi:hypothetical protein